MNDNTPKSGGNNPMDAPATLPKGEKPNVDPAELPDSVGTQVVVGGGSAALGAGLLVTGLLLLVIAL